MTDPTPLPGDPDDIREDAKTDPVPERPEEPAPDPEGDDE